MLFSVYPFHTLTLLFLYIFFFSNTNEWSKQTLKSAVGDKLQVGEADGQIGIGEVETLTPGSKEVEPLVRLVLVLDTAPPPPSPVTVAVALTRSKTFPKVLETLVVLGVKKIFIINTERVEPGYWHTHTLQPEAIRDRLTLGLEQTVDTAYPEVVLCKNFERFIAKQTPSMLVEGATNLIAHPDPDGVPCPHDVTSPCNLLIGPEGGFIGPEVERFKELGFTCVSLGTRILPVQTAVHVLLGKLGYG